MKALSIKQPYASWIVDGHKTLEVRTWTTNYRGPLAIHASKTPVRGVDHDPEWALGAVIGIAELVDCRPMRRGDRHRALVPHDNDERYVLELESPTWLGEPIALRGQIYMFDPPDNVIAALRSHRLRR